MSEDVSLRKTKMKETFESESSRCASASTSPSGSTSKDSREVCHIRSSQLPLIYQKLIEEQRPLRAPMKLKWVIRVLYSEWQKQDWFPKE